MSRTVSLCLAAVGLVFACSTPARFDEGQSETTSGTALEPTNTSASAAVLEARTLELARSLARKSDGAVAGEVVSAAVHPEGPAGAPGIHTLVEIKVAETLLGSPGSAVSFWVQGGELGRKKRVVTGQASYRPGERVLVFLYTSPSGARWPTEMGRGKWRLEGGRVRPSVGNLEAVSISALRSVRGGAP